MEPKVTIIIPIYNVEKYLKRCLNSVLNQTYTNIQIILVDDGSQDKSFALMQQYQSQDQRIQCLQKTNGGLSSARNFALSYVEGEFIMFVDSDDFIKLDTIELMLSKALETSCDIVACDMEYLYDDGHIEYASAGEFTLDSFEKSKELLFINNSACNKLIKSSLLNNLVFPEGLWYEDLALIPILVTQAKSIAHVNKPLYVYYQRANSIAHSVNPKIFDIYDAIEMVEKKVDANVKSMYILHGLDLTTLRIKNFDNKKVRKEYLKKNMELLYKFYPNWKDDELLKKYSLKKKLIFKLMDYKMFDLVLKIYDR